MPLPRGSRVGSYEVSDLLGAGGMGEVYRARDTRLGRDVAIKILPERFASDSDRRARFEREAQLLASLNHPNIATVHGLEDRALVMELVEGPTLADRLRRGPLPIPEALAIARQLVDALEAAHGRGIVHRDLKPANVKVRPDGTVKVLDFGIAKLSASAVTDGIADVTGDVTAFGETRPGLVLGTTAYMSPEQARGHSVDARTDIWAFGCVLFELLTGAAPFDGGTVTDTVAAILERQPSWGRLPAGTPPAIRRLLRRCLEKSASARLADIAEARPDLQAAPRRPWMPWAAAALVVVGIIGALIAGRGAFTSLGAPAAPQIRSVAVLPLADVSAKSDEDYFSNGMTEELIGAMSKIRAWRVISRTSVMQYKAAAKPLPTIAEELGVDALVEGTVQRAGDRVRISVRLVRAGRNEENLWAQSFDRDMRDVLDVQADVARSIASQIRLTLTPGEEARLAARRPVDPEVLRLYLQGKAAIYQGTEDAIFRGIAYFTQALEKDPMNAQAHAAMALAYGMLNPAYRPPKEVMPKSRQYALRAIELDETVSEAYTALASVLFRFDWNWNEAERQIKHAIDLNPNSADAHELYGTYLTAVAKHSEAIAELRLARELNPSSLATYSSLLAAFITARRYDEGIAEARRALDAHPDFAFASAWLGMGLVLKGQIAEAIPHLERARQLDNNVTTSHFLAMAQAAAGNKAEARRLIDDLAKAADTRYTCAYEIGSVYLQLGERETAVQWLRRGIEEQCDCMVWLKTEPWMDPLRVDPRYADLIKRVGFPES
jgi:eukaryotic-like serine/threonine-protein kinase